MKNEIEEEDSQFNPMKINEQNVICNECGGIGSIRTTSPVSRYAQAHRVPCAHCKGKGQLDWISSIMKK